MTDPKRDDRLLPTVRDAASNLLDVLDRTPNNGGPFVETIAACRALRAALDEPAPEPLTQMVDGVLRPVPWGGEPAPETAIERRPVEVDVDASPLTVLPGVDLFELTDHIDGLKAEVERYKGLYEAAVKGRAEFRDALRAERGDKP